MGQLPHLIAHFFIGIKMLDIDFAELANIAELDLELKHKINFEFKPNSHKWMRAYHEAKINSQGKLKSHKIVIYMGDVETETRNLMTILIHELIHAWQTEQIAYNGANPEMQDHGIEFQEMAQHLQQIYFYWNIYDPELDV